MSHSENYRIVSIMELSKPTLAYDKPQFQDTFR